MLGRLKYHIFLLQDIHIIFSGTKYNVYSHAKSDEAVVRTLSYSLPRILHDHIDVIAPTTYFGTLRSMRVTSFLQPEIVPAEPQPETEALVRPISAAAVPSSCSSSITPACLRALYNTTTYVPAVRVRQTL
jgi:tripeptidyl-peptidase I